MNYHEHVSFQLHLKLTPSPQWIWKYKYYELLSCTWLLHCTRVFMRFPVPELNRQICISPAQGRSSKLTHRCCNWHLCIPDGLSVVQCSLEHVIGVAFLTQFQWREAYVLDNWQLAELPQSGGREFDPRRVYDNSSVPLWVYMRFPVQEHQN